MSPAKPRRRPPGPRALPLTGHLYALRGAIYERLARDRARYGNVVAYRIARRRYCMLSDPDLIRYVLHEHKADFSKRTESNEQSKLITGESVLTADGPSWHRRRRLLQPAFRPQAVLRYAPAMAQACDELLARWARDSAAKDVVDVSRDMSALTYAIVGQVLLSADLDSSAAQVYGDMEAALSYIFRRIESPLRLPLAVPTPARRRFSAAVANFDAVVADLLLRRRAGGEPRHDLLAALLAARDDDGASLWNDAELRDELVTLLLAGHETTANLLSWLWYLLGRQPEWQDRLYEEAQGADDWCAADLLRQVISETLRLYPPIWLMERRVERDAVLAGYAVPRGVTVVVSPYVMHRHNDYWPEPQRFDPERFTSSATQQRPDYVYLPFGRGPRMCIGMNFAVQEAMIIASRVLRRFRLVPVDDAPLLPRAGITLRPGRDLLMRVVPR